MARLLSWSVAGWVTGAKPRSPSSGVQSRGVTGQQKLRRAIDDAASGFANQDRLGVFDAGISAFGPFDPKAVPAVSQMLISRLDDEEEFVCAGLDNHCRAPRFDEETLPDRQQSAREMLSI